MRLLTNPVAAGYVQNPISVYYCYAASTDGRGAERDQARTPRDSCSAQPTSDGQGGGAQGCSAADRPFGDCSTSQAASGARDGGPQGCSTGTRRGCGNAQAACGGRSGGPHGCRSGGGAPLTGRLQRCIAEVTNTPWGARVTFVFDPGQQAVPKAMHVSPLMDMRSTWCAGLLAPHQDSGALVNSFISAQWKAAPQTGKLLAWRAYRNIVPTQDAALHSLCQQQTVAIAAALATSRPEWRGVPTLPSDTRMSHCMT